MEHNFLNNDSPQPLYQQVAGWMTENIQTKTWPKGHKLLAEEDLAKELNISRGTLRKAIALLIEKELLVQIQGKGTFVDQPKISYPFAQELISFAESMDKRKYHFETKVLEQTVVQPSGYVQNKLNLAENEMVLYLKRVRLIQQEPAIILENWIALDRCEGIEQENFEEISLFKAIEKSTNTKLSYGIRSFSAKALRKDEADLLHLQAHDPVLSLEQVTYGQKNIPLEYSEVLLRTDKYEVTSILTRE
ncbi:UTRA domain-containing protein [Virgibacillus halodenitrificans]|uniref:GntR family transcriptional regulator n=1 Tax=Virgibacillus halodenitrificans TaxID=1482 RepID=UPI00136BCB80|nr:GntR family transcriptional regulator [Virgibacillus halodenitrificans]MYL47112.1 UTRA domain-containing protein [Virgibacillus halodenitrificans]WHX26223.1 GntR family transcriptional regulator [Virgibacillus halodenitrificans]